MSKLLFGEMRYLTMLLRKVGPRGEVLGILRGVLGKIRASIGGYLGPTPLELPTLRDRRPLA